MKRSLSQFCLEIQILTILKKKFFYFFKRNFQAKIGFILLPFTDHLPVVNDFNLQVTGGKPK